MGQIKVDCDQDTNLALSSNLLSSLKCPATDLGILACFSSERLLHLLIEAQILIRKGDLYDAIGKEINRLLKFQPAVFAALSCRSTDYKGGELEDGPELPILSLHRDVAINNLRFLSIFYNSGPNSFYVATNLMDRLLGKIMVSRKALPIVATCCFYLATCYANESSIPIDLGDLMKLTQCETTREIFLEVASRIRNEVGFCEQRPVTPLSFLELFYGVFALQDELLQGGSVIKAFLMSRMELFLCQFEFTKFRYDLIALAFLQYFLQQIGLFNHLKQLTVVELQYYCRMDEDAYRECLSMIERYTFEYETRETKRPKLKLSWTISRRLLLKRRPSLLVRSNLEPVMEEESSEEMILTTPASSDIADESFRDEASEDGTLCIDHKKEMEEAKTGGKEGPSNCKDEGGTKADVNKWKLGTNSVVSEDEGIVIRPELHENDAISMDEEISSISCDVKSIDESDRESEGNGDYLSRIYDNGMENNGDFNECGFNINDSCMSAIKDLQVLIVSKKTEECKSYCNSFLDSQRNVDNSSLVSTDGCTRSSFESSSSFREGECKDKFIVNTADKSFMEMKGGCVLTENDTLSSKFGLVSDDNNNCVMRII